MGLLYIITGQKKEYWAFYKVIKKLQYKLLYIKILRIWTLKDYYKNKYGILGTIILLYKNLEMKTIKVPFKLYKSVETYIIRNIIMLMLGLYIYINYDKKIRFYNLNNIHDDNVLLRQ